MKFPHISAYPWSVDLRPLWNGKLTLESNDKLGWPVPVPGFLRIPIDHCLLSDDFQVTSVEVGSSIGSDHLPLVVTARLK